MKPLFPLQSPSSNRKLHLASLLLLALVPPLLAQNLYWDTNTSTTGIQGGNGTWNTSQYWNSSSTGTGTFSGWTANSSAHFSANNSTVDLEGSSWDVDSMTMNGVITVTLTNGTINLNSGLTTLGGFQAKTLNATIALTANQTFTLANTFSQTVTIAGALNVGAHELGINFEGGGMRSNISANLTGSGNIIISNGNPVLVSVLSGYAAQFTGNNTGFTGDYIINKGVLGAQKILTGYTKQSAVQFGNTTDAKEFNWNQSSAVTLGGLNSNGGSGAEYVTGGSWGAGVMTIDTSVTGGGFNFAGTLLSYSVTGLTKAGAGTQGFSGTNTIDGNLTITGGTLQLGNGGTTGSFTGINAITNNANLTINRSNDFTQATDLNGKAITGSGSLTQAGSGRVILSAENTYSGGTTITAGTLQIGAGETTGSIAGTITTQGGGVLEFNRSDATTVSNTLAGNGTFRQIGGNTLTLDGTNTTNGTIDVTNGTILFSGANALPSNGSLSASASGTLSVADGTTRNSTLAGGLTMDGGSFVFDINSTSSDYLAFTGAASLSGTNVVKLNLSNTTASTWTLMTAASGLNGGTWSLDPSSFNTGGLTWTLSSTASALTLTAAVALNNFYWTGNTSASWGTADNWSSDSAGSSPRATTPGAGDDLFFTATTAKNLSTTLGANFTVNRVLITDSGVSIAGGYSITANASSVAAFAVSAASGTTTIEADLKGGNAGLTKSGSGSLTLSGSNTYGGATTISGGTLTVAGGAAIADTGAVILSDAAGAVFSISASETIGSLQGGGTSGGNVTIASGQTLTVAETGNNTFSGVVEGAGSLVKSGAGSMLLTGANTYSGATTISAGTLQIGVGGSLGSIASTSGITNNATLVFNRSGSLVVTPAISGTGDIAQIGGGITVLAGNSTYTGSTTISAGTLQIGNGGTSGSIASTSGITNNATLAFNRSDSFTFSTAVTGSGHLSQTGSGTLVVTGSNSYSGTTTLEAGSLRLDSAHAIGTTGNVTFTGGALVFSANNTNDISSRIVSSSSAIKIDTNGQTVIFATGLSDSNTGGLVKSGDGTLILAANNDYDGAAVINAGTLQIGNGGATGALNGNQFTVYKITNNGTLVFNTTSNLNINYADFSGTGDVVQNGSGTLDFWIGGRVSSSGNFTINSGTVTTRCIDKNIWDNANLVVNGGTFSFQAPVVFSTVKLISGQILNTLAASSVQTLSATNGFVFEGGTLGANITLAGGSLTKNGSGTLELNGANIFTGATVVNSGTLKANAAGALANTSNITVSGGSLLVTASNAIGDSTGIELAGGNLTFSGNVTDTIGALTLSANSVIDLGTGSVVAIFADLFMGNYTLAVHNWTGTAFFNGGTGNNTDQIYFNRALGGSELQRISFYSDFGSDFLGTGFQLGLGSGFQYEVIAVPEAETWVAAALLLAGAGVAWMRGRRRKSGNMDGQDQQDGARS